MKAIAAERVKSWRPSPNEDFDLLLVTLSSDPVSEDLSITLVEDGKYKQDIIMKDAVTKSIHGEREKNEVQEDDDWTEGRQTMRE